MNAPTYPGVYIREIASGNRTIVGVATSITAFVGRALRGPVNEATTITSWANFQRVFGGLWAESPMSYAVSQFFAAGGSRAVIVRVTSSAGTATLAATAAPTSFLQLEDARTTRTDSLRVSLTAGTGDDEFVLTFQTSPDGSSWSAATPSSTTVSSVENAAAELSGHALVRLVGTAPVKRPDALANQVFTAVGGAPGQVQFDCSFSSLSVALTFTASSPGIWGNRLYVAIDHTTSETDPALFNLTVTELDADGQQVTQEVFRNVSLGENHPRHVSNVVAEESSLLATVAVTVTDSASEISYDDGGMRPDDFTAARLTGGSPGSALVATDIIGTDGDAESATGMYALAQADLFNLLCLPPPSFATGSAIDSSSWANALIFCALHRAVCIVDAPPTWDSASDAEGAFEDLALTSENGAMYFPRVRIADPLRENRLSWFAPCGVVAGLISRTDATRGIWKAPAGLDARTPIVRELEANLTDDDHGLLNPLGLNCLRTFRGVGTVVWGARTLAGNDRLASDWKYLPVRRTALYIEESLYRGLQWAVFEPNDEPLWAQIRLACGTFMHQMFRQGAFQGASAKDAYFVKCDSETTTDADIDRGIVNVLIGFAPLKPAEFVILSLQQIAGQSGV